MNTTLTAVTASLEPQTGERMTPPKCSEQHSSEYEERVGNREPPIGADDRAVSHLASSQCAILVTHRQVDPGQGVLPAGGLSPGWPLRLMGWTAVPSVRGSDCLVRSPALSCC